MESHLPEPPPVFTEAAEAAAARLPPPRVWPIFVTWVVAHLGIFVLGALAMVGWAVVMSARDPRLRTDTQRMTGLLQAMMTSPRFLIASSTLSAAVLGGTALVGANLSREGVQARLRTGPSNLSLVRFLVAAVGFVAIGEAGSAFVAWAHVPLSGMLPWMSRAMAGASGASLVGAVLSVGLFAGLGEELFFRGFMQARLRRRWGAWPAVLVTAAAFGIAHMNPVHSALAFAMGLYAGWLLERTGSIRPGMAGHVVNNTLCVLLSAAFPAGVEEQIGAGRCLAMALVALVACIALLGRNPAAPAVAPQPGRRTSGAPS